MDTTKFVLSLALALTPPIEKNGMVYDQVFERQRIETLLKYLVTEIKTEVREEMLRELNKEL